MSPYYLPACDLRLALRWTAEGATPSKIAVAVPEPEITRRMESRIFLLDPTDRRRNILLEATR